MDAITDVEVENAFFRAAQKHFENYITQNADQFFKDETAIVGNIVYDENDARREGVPFEPWMLLSCEFSYACTNGERTFKYTHIGGHPDAPHQLFEVNAYYDELKEIMVELKTVVDTSNDYHPLEVYLIFVETAINFELHKEMVQQEILQMLAKPSTSKPKLSVVR